MSRYQSGHKEQTYKKILKTSVGLFLKQGYLDTGVEQIMKIAGLTQGGFYAHFKSKEDLFTQTIQEAFQHSYERLFKGMEKYSGATWIKEIVKRYISREHRNKPFEGCPAAALTADVSRSSDDVKQTFEAELILFSKKFADHIPSSSRFSNREKALALVALGIGAISLSRAIKSTKLSDQILLSSRKMCRLLFAEDV